MATDVTPVTTSEPEPPWWRAPRPQGRRRNPLSREAIVDAAVAILDEEGVDALTVRRLGQALNTGSATLYWHINGKDELHELVYDRIMGEVELPEADPAHWQDQLKDLARQTYKVMLAHKDAVRLSLGRVPVGPNMLRIMEWSLELLRQAGVPSQPAAYFGDIFGRFLDASVLEVSPPDGGVHAASPEMMRDYFGSLPSDRFPNIAALATAMFEGNDDDRFEFGLDLLIRGLEALAQPAR